MHPRHFHATIVPRRFPPNRRFMSKTVHETVVARRPTTLPRYSHEGLYDALVSRDIFDRKQQKSQQVLSRNSARRSADWKRTDSHTSHASHTQQNRQKEGSQRTFARPRTLQELHHSAPNNNVQRRTRRRRSNNQRIIRTATKSLTSQSHLISQILLLLFRLDQTLSYAPVLAQTGSLVHV